MVIILRPVMDGYNMSLMVIIIRAVMDGDNIEACLGW